MSWFSNAITSFQDTVVEQMADMNLIDVYVENQNAQKLYTRQGFVHRGFHMVKELGQGYV